MSFKQSVDVFGDIEFNNGESAYQSVKSIGKLLAADGHTNNQLHPTAVVTFPDDKGCRRATTTLIDQCCTGQGLISHKQAKALKLNMNPISKNKTTTFKTEAGTFKANK